ncbi:transglycosylase SLT domain-containing protein [bacterium]|nr:transglycosylase SLT domain-containing protein [bacterium]
MRRRSKFDLYFVIFLLVFTVAYFIYNIRTSEARGVEHYSQALKLYKGNEFEKAYHEFGKVPSSSGLKQSALFRQARCATNIDRKDIAIKKYKKILRSHSKSAIVPISEYNMAYLMYEAGDKEAKKHYKKIIKKYPQSDYAIASQYYLGNITIQNLPENEKKQKKIKENALVYFKTYLEKAPDGRFALNSIEEIKNLDTTLNNFDNLLIAKGYYANGEYEKARTYLNKTTLAESWTDFAKTEYKLGNKEKGNGYTEKGLKDFPSGVEQNDVFEVIDLYVSAAATRKDGINKLNALNLKSTGADYAAYLNCNEVVLDGKAKEACYRKLYEKYPNGQFSADSLYNVFLSKYLQKKYYDAQRLGFLHIKKFPNVKSSPAVIYYMAKIANKLKHYESSDNYFKKVIAEYPDSYYAFRAHFNLYKDDGFLPFLEINPKPVIFPYRRSLDNNLVVKLAYLKDYDLVEELCKNDKFIQSWVAYEKGNYTISAVLARKAMEDIYPKPDFEDLRWRLIYPLHYYDIVDKLKGNNNPIILESIIKEESHFNPYAKSSVGADGLMQLMPSTFSEVVQKNSIPQSFNNETKNIAAGSIYYSGLKRALGNKDLYAISAYNGGIGSVRGWFDKIIYSDTDEFVEQIPYPETKNYVKKVLRTYWMYGNIY